MAAVADSRYGELLEKRRAKLKAELASAFPQPTELVLEIGSGHGHFLTAYALQHHDRPCLGVDAIGERVERANRKRNRARLGHLHFMHADARLLLESLPSSAVIARVFVLFPDPWPKTRHHKHRIIQPDFLTLLGAHVTPGAELLFRTDDDAYFNFAYQTTHRHPEWRMVDTMWPFEFESVFQQRARSFRSFIALART